MVQFIHYQILANILKLKYNENISIIFCLAPWSVCQLESNL